jgi:hypothetical protein
MTIIQICQEKSQNSLLKEQASVKIYQAPKRHFFLSLKQSILELR